MSGSSALVVPSRLLCLPLMVLATLVFVSHAFLSPGPLPKLSSRCDRPQTVIVARSGVTSTTNDGINKSSSSDDAVQALMRDVEQKMIRRNGNIDVKALEPTLARIENFNTYKEPNRSSTYKGQWYTW